MGNKSSTSKQLNTLPSVIPSKQPETQPETQPIRNNMISPILNTYTSYKKPSKIDITAIIKQLLSYHIKSKTKGTCKEIDSIERIPKTYTVNITYKTSWDTEVYNFNYRSEYESQFIFYTDNTCETPLNINDVKKMLNLVFTDYHYKKMKHTNPIYIGIRKIYKNNEGIQLKLVATDTFGNNTYISQFIDTLDIKMQKFLTNTTIGGKRRKTRKQRLSLHRLLK